ncbi:MAG TPA: hypothetical protein VLE99_02035 [Candidatus Saccharimonadales bacterium]|nr:hypothetical protein [Candidatus Saccharimonadales bacterium]
MTAQDWLLILGWGSPIGLGIFFVSGTLSLYLLAKIAKIDFGKKD